MSSSISSPTTSNEPILLSRSTDITGDSNFPQGCQISPDGLCVLTATAADNVLRLYNIQHNIQVDQQQSSSINHDASNATKEHQPSSWQSSLIAREGDSIRSYCWYPLMDSYQPLSCAFLATSRDQPIHLIDAYNSIIRASYRTYNALDEMESPNVVTFTPDGQRIFASGFRTDRMIQVFDTAIPGRDATILRLGKTRRSKDGQKGITSALSFPNDNNNVFGSTRCNVFAVGTYSPGSIYIYDDRRPSGDPAATILHGGMCICGHGKNFTRKKRRFVDISEYNEHCNANNYSDIAKDEASSADEEDIFSMAKVNWYQSRARGGVTSLQWSTGSDFYLYSASRRSDAVLKWDMRVLSGSDSHPIRGIMSFPRDSSTNQRLEFDLNENGTMLITASQDKTVKIYDTTNGSLIRIIKGFDDVVNGVSIKKNLNGNQILAVAMGARRFDAEITDELCDFDKDVPIVGKVPGSLSLFQL